MSERRSTTPRAAAFFDLDRTLIAGPSATVFSHSLRAAGISQRHIPGTAAVAASYRVLGETALTAATARARGAGDQRVVVRGSSAQAAEAAAEELLDDRAALRPGRDRGAPRRRAGRRDGDDQPGPPRCGRSPSGSGWTP